LSATKVSFEDWMAFFQQEERDIMQKKVSKAFESGNKNWVDSFQFMGQDGRMSNVIIRSNIIRDDDGNAIRMIGVIHDISKMQKLEEVLDWELMVKKNQITEAVIEARETERSDIGKELHDNVNQILAASMLYLDMARKDIKNGEIYLIHSSEYISTAIEEIRKLTKGLIADKYFELCAEIEHVARDIMKIHPIRIRCKLKPSLEKAMSNKFKLNTYRIVQEHLNNILKHASASEIQITMSEVKTGFVLSIVDNGIGFDITKKRKNAGIGISNIINRTEYFRGKASFITRPGNGCKLVLTFPITTI
jgi:two-component system sensor histidine kinase UhpB